MNWEERMHLSASAYKSPPAIPRKIIKEKERATKTTYQTNSSSISFCVQELQWGETYVNNPGYHGEKIAKQMRNDFLLQTPSTAEPET